MPPPLLPPPVPDPGLSTWQALFTSLAGGFLGFATALITFRGRLAVHDEKFLSIEARVKRELELVHDKVTREAETTRGEIARLRTDTDRRHEENLERAREESRHVSRKLNVLIEAGADLMASSGLDKRYKDAATRLLAEVSVMKLSDET